MFFQAILDILIVLGVIYLLYVLLLKSKLKERKEGKRIAKEEKLAYLKQKEIDMKQELNITKDLIVKEEEVSALTDNLTTLDKQLKESENGKNESV
jgi:hypothetical protein